MGFTPEGQLREGRREARQTSNGGAGRVKRGPRRAAKDAGAEQAREHSCPGA